MKKLSLIPLAFFAAILCAAQAIALSTPPAGAVLTWHDDNFRTGWQQQETILTNSTLGTLGISRQVTLKDQVDAQVLVIPGFIGGHDIAFVADESNHVYQIDANAGTILHQVNLGSPVPRPLKCGSNGPNVGINGTPTIDWASQTLFVIAYVNVNGTTPSYFLHALDLTSLKDKVSPPVPVKATHPLTDGAAFKFNATNQRQRAGLLFANGNVYAAFASFCDFHPTNNNPTGNSSRGWLLGWSWNGSNSLTALEANQLDDRQSSSPTSYQLDSIWMSGAGPASDESGNLIFSTGNSGGSNTPWVDTTPCSGTATGSLPTSVPCSNVQESVVKLKGDLTSIVGLFSPNSAFGSFSPNTLQLDQEDGDLGSGGVLLVPQLGTAFLAAMAGKDGRLFLLDRFGTRSNGLHFLQFSKQSHCWCAPSYFKGSDGIGRIVTSQGSLIHTFKVRTTSLSQVGTSTITTGQDGGFFTTVSCAGIGAFGSCTNTPIIWAISRPISSLSTGVNLYAFSGLAVSGSYPLLFGPKQVGSWPNIGGNANIVPTVSHGLVYVASNKLLTILKNRGTAAPLPAQLLAPETSTFAISGILHGAKGSVLNLTNRNGKDRPVDISQATVNGNVAAALSPGEAYTAVGTSFTTTGALLADAIYRAKCRQHNDAGEDLTGARPACTGDQWPPDKDAGQ